jgi:DNA-binding transcriptional regulator GbsR (MarR family)
MSKLSPIAEKFVLHWGEMGTRWGVNRTVAQVHALLYISPRPMHAEEITETLSVARSNVSTSLRELQGWGIVRVIHVMGDRRDHFESMKDVFEMFRIVLMERKRREIDPTVAVLRECVAEAQKGGSAEAHNRERLAELLLFFETMDMLFGQMKGLPPKTLIRLAKAGDKVSKALKFVTGTRG